VDFNKYISKSREPFDAQFDIQLAKGTVEAAEAHNDEDHSIQKEVGRRAGIDFETGPQGKAGLKIFLHDTTHPLKKCDVNGKCNRPDDEILVDAVEDGASARNKDKIRTIPFDYE